MHRSFASNLFTAIAATLAFGLASCGGAENSNTPAAQAERRAAFEWPSSDAPTAMLQIQGMGEMRIALFPQLAPATVENFSKLTREGFYTGTTFHRVVPGFAIQGGSNTSRDQDPRNDGHGGPGYMIEDEFSDAPHLRGVVAMANHGRENSGGSQFFIVHQDHTELDGHYSVFGRVVEGLDVLDAITQVEIDTAGRWGSPDRPIENVVIEAIRIEQARAGHAQSAAGSGSQPTS